MKTFPSTETSITRGRKFDQVRDGASAIFLRDGYAAASVDDIARSARVSKATLYSYFPEKSLMFREVLRETLSQAFAHPPFEANPEGPVAEALPAILADLARWSLTDARLSLLRVVMSEANRFPDEARAYHRASEQHVIAPLARVIDRWIASGELRAHDSQASARQLAALVTCALQQGAVLRGSDPDAAVTTARTAELFLSAHAA